MHRSLLWSGYAAAFVLFAACGGKTVGVDPGGGDSGSGSGSGSSTGTGSGSGSSTGTGSGTGSSTGSGSGSGSSTGSGSGSSTGTGSGSGSGSGEVCPGEAPQCPWCNGTIAASCTSEGWQCPPPPPCVAPIPDSGLPDVGVEPDAGSAACGTLSCDPANTYCVIESPGTPTPDGGGSSSYACVIYPPECGAFPNCACLSQNSGGCVCTQTATGALTLDCGE